MNFTVKISSQFVQGGGGQKIPKVCVHTLWTPLTSLSPATWQPDAERKHCCTTVYRVIIRTIRYLDSVDFAVFVQDSARFSSGKWKLGPIGRVEWEHPNQSQPNHVSSRINNPARFRELRIRGVFIKINRSGSPQPRSISRLLESDWPSLVRFQNY